MPHVKRIVAAILREVERILRGLGFVRTAGVADAVRVGPLEPGGEALREAAVERGLHRIVMIGAAAGLIVDLRELRAVLQNW